MEFLSLFFGLINRFLLFRNHLFLDLGQKVKG